ncbi:hypothetical protein K3J84_003736 [Salmonella enterica]|nr:hypothetical protein [Salmonella enterica subsp. enterica serovar Oslo]EHW8352193.1 hypothetical protein [Salmonella enterica]
MRGATFRGFTVLANNRCYRLIYRMSWKDEEMYLASRQEVSADDDHESDEQKPGNNTCRPRQDLERLSV